MRWIVCLVFVLCNSTGIFAQTIVNTENSFLAALDKANNLNWFLQSSPYRIINTGEIILNFKGESFDRQLSSYKTILEEDKKIGTRTIYEVSKNSVKEKYESVQIRGKYGKYFERNDDGNWQQVAKLSKTLATMTLPNSRAYKKDQESSEIIQKIIEYSYVGREEVNAQITDVYITIERRAETEPSKKEVRTQTRRFWFAQDGKILKVDTEITVESNGGISRSHYIQTWEIDKDIKIEVPELPFTQ